MPITVEELQGIEPDAFEVLIGDLLDAKGFINVLRLGGSGDEGVDLRAEWLEELPTGHTRLGTWAIQCKRYKAAVSQKEIREMLNSVLEPPHDLLLRHPDYFLIATSSSVSVNGHRTIERANKNPSKYGCHFVVWEGSYIVAELNKHDHLATRHFPQAQKPIATPADPITRLQVICDELPTEVVLTFVLEDGSSGSSSLLDRTKVSPAEFESLVHTARTITIQRSSWHDQMYDPLEGMGNRLFSIIPEAVQIALRQGRGCLRLTSNVHVLPFEVAYDDERQEFLGSRYHIGRIQFADHSVLKVPWGAPSILLVAPANSVLPPLRYAEEEVASLAALFRPAIDVTVLSGQNATAQALSRVISEREYQIFTSLGMVRAPTRTSSG